MGVILREQSGPVEWGVWDITESIDELLTLAEERQLDCTPLEAFKSLNRRAQWLAVRLLATQLEPGCRITYSETGKPELAQCGISISHSHEKIAVSINRAGETGIDVQKLVPKIHRIAHKFLTPEEAEWVREDLVKTTWCWSIKESLYKLYGDGSPYFEVDYRIRRSQVLR